MTAEVSLLGQVDTAELDNESNGQDQVYDLKAGDQTQTFERPKDVPEEYWDDKSGSYKGDQLLNALKAEQQKALGLRQKLSRGHQNAPSEANAYQLQVDDQDIQINEDDDGIQLFRNIAFKNNLSQEQFNGVVSEFFNAYKEGNLESNDNEDDDPEFAEEQAIAYMETERNKLGENANQILTNINAFGRQLYKQGVLSKDDLETFKNIGVSAENIRLLDKLRTAAGYISDIPIDVQPLSNLPSKEEIDQIVASPEYQTDRVLQKKVSDYFVKVYGI